MRTRAFSLTACLLFTPGWKQEKRSGPLYCDFTNIPFST